MLKEKKITFTNVYKNDQFRLVIEKLTTNKELAQKERSFILSCALLFLNEYIKDKRYISYVDFAYYLILKYSLQYEDYKPLYDLSINLGLYPISKALLENKVIEVTSVNNFLIEQGLKNYFNGFYYETLEQFNAKNSFLKNKKSEKAFIAPTSFGKSSLIIDYIKQSGMDSRIGIIVPTKSLLSQTYKMIRDNNLDYKLLIHDEMYTEENAFIAIFTQERALRLLAKNDTSFDHLIIDEAHKLLDKDSRSILLSRLVSKNKNLNSETRIVYLSPLINDIKAIKVTKKQKIKTFSVLYNIKEPEIFEFKDTKVIKHNRFFVRDNNESELNYGSFFIDEVKDYYSYVAQYSNKKNFIYSHRPIYIEKIALEFSETLDPIEPSEALLKLISELEREVHESFYCIECLKKGVIYIHGMLPDLIKEFLEHKFKDLSDIKYIVANNVILEGINLPIDSLFIFSTRYLNGKQLTNLIGRVNRLNEVFENNNLQKLLPRVHFVNNREFNSSNSMFNKIKLLRSRIFSDEIENPTLDGFNISKVTDQIEKNKIQKIQENEKLLLKTPLNLRDRLEQYFIEYNIVNNFKDPNILIDSVLKKLENQVSKSGEWKRSSILEKVRIIFFDKVENIDDFEFSRLNNDAALNYYEHFINVTRKKSLKENVNSLVKYFQRRSKDLDDKKRKFYFGTSYGEEEYYSGDYSNPRYKTYIDVGKIKDQKRLVNLAIVKMNLEEEFISFTLNKFIIFLYDFDLIHSNEYFTYLYGTTDSKKIELTKFGLNIGLIAKLDSENQLKNLSLDSKNNLIANESFNNYLQTLTDFQRFEIDRFVN